MIAFYLCVFIIIETGDIIHYRYFQGLDINIYVIHIFMWVCNNAIHESAIRINTIKYVYGALFEENLAFVSN